MTDKKNNDDNKTKLKGSLQYRLIVIFLLVIIGYFSFQLTENYKEEDFDISRFTDYYEGSIADNGGVEVLLDSFYTFERKYNFTGDYMQLPPKEGQEDRLVTKSIYVVQSGDTIKKIADKFKISENTIKANNISVVDRVKKNQKLVIPSEDGVFYKTVQGDTLNRISTRFKVKTSDIMNYNAIDPKKIPINKDIFLKNVNLSFYIEEIRPKPKIEPKPVITGTGKPGSGKPGKIEGTKTPKVKELATSPGREGFILPVRYAGVTSGFGNRFHPVLKKYILHAGVDLVAKYVPLRASKDGVVSFAGNMSGYGKIIIIKHDNGYETRYAHLSQISTSVGSKVSQGQMIGTTGKSGRVTGPHLHFEIRKNGSPVNPMKLAKY